DSTAADIAKLDFAGINPVTGPIFVEGAEPGDALKVTIEMFKPSGFGWTANIPGFGLLADDFKEPALNIWKYDAASLEPALFGKNARVPLKPFAGTTGNALAEMGHHSVVPPR
ncbi:acetamidase/formamidase family protein, partial [Mesorhizobium sp. M1C.F.Ca.ET.187.01.1.1]|uniref:acetamidase/formamidase family protein n=1 Tax=Mesorhizobium sp. M1C.F.Ca.ET.187.01.1.1 TaxID=2563923 RepID=UPI0011373CEE